MAATEPLQWFVKAGERPSRRMAAPVPDRRTHGRHLARPRPHTTQRLRQGFQIAFLLLNIWIGAQFYVFVRYYESGGSWPWVARPAGVEGWLPIAGLMGLKLTVLTGRLPAIHPAGVVLLVTFLAIALLVRKSFCSWLCPIGTVSEWLWQTGAAMLGRHLHPPRWLDVPLRSLKYVLLALFGFAVLTMSAQDIRAFLSSPYGLIADVKMLNFFRHIGAVGATVIVVLVLLSIPIQNAWCRYLCPYGALLGLVALASPLRIARHAERCIDCGKCARACPSRLPVDQLPTVRSAECTACLLCLDACPAAGALDLRTASRAPVRTWVVAASVAALFLGAVGLAKLSGHWDTTLPDALYFHLVPRASQYSHP